jgi:hypothetical protein
MSVRSRVSVLMKCLKLEADVNRRCQDAEQIFRPECNTIPGSMDSDVELHIVLLTSRDRAVVLPKLSGPSPVFRFTPLNLIRLKFTLRCLMTL